jgi:hypothetical protein
MEKALRLLNMVEIKGMFQTALTNEFYNQDHQDPCGLSSSGVDPDPDSGFL